MRFPKNLEKNGTIGFVAPSFGCATEPYKSAFDSGLKMWESLGYSYKLGPNCYAGDGIGISSTPQACAKELTDAYCDSDIDVIISCGGGEMMCETISLVDFIKIREAEPKWYMGYSDNTNFTFLLNTMCDVASIYGPCAGSFGAEKLHKSHEYATDILTSKSASYEFSGFDKWEKVSLKDEENPLAPYNLDTDSYVRAYLGKSDLFTDETVEEKEVSMEGRMIGGCLDCLINLCGTRFDYVSQFNEKYGKEGIIWFLEACDLNMMSIRRAMWQLENAGWFEQAAGFIIGRPRLFGDTLMGLDQYKAVYDIISRHNVPIIMDADLGHLSPTIPLISGSYAKVCAGGGKWKIEMQKR